LPDVKSMNEWVKWDYILIGSSGFWDICKFQSKTTIEKINNSKIHEIMKEFATKNDIEWVEKENSSLLLQKLLVKLVKEGIGKGEK
jgi:hypothetical protein